MQLTIWFIVAMVVFVGGLMLAVNSIASQPPQPPQPPITENTLVKKGVEVVEKGIEKSPVIIENGLDKASEALDNL